MVGLQMDVNGKELLQWAINRVAERGDRIVAVTVCRDSDLKNAISTLSILTVLEDFLAPYEDTCNFKMVSLVGRVVLGSSIRKTLVNEAKICGATSIVVGANKHISIGSSALVAKYCAKKLPPTISLITVQDGRVIFEKKATFEKASPGEAPPPSLPSMLHRRLCMQHRMAIPNSEEEAGKESLKSSNSGFENNGKKAILNAKNHVSEGARGEGILCFFSGAVTINPSQINYVYAAQLELINKKEDEEENHDDAGETLRQSEQGPFDKF